MDLGVLHRRPVQIQSIRRCWPHKQACKCQVRMMRQRQARSHNNKKKQGWLLCSSATMTTLLEGDVILSGC